MQFSFAAILNQHKITVDKIITVDSILNEFRIFIRNIIYTHYAIDKRIIIHQWFLTDVPQNIGVQ